MHESGHWWVLSTWIICITNARVGTGLLAGYFTSFRGTVIFHDSWVWFWVRGIIYQQKLDSECCLKLPKICPLHIITSKNERLKAWSIVFKFSAVRHRVVLRRSRPSELITFQNGTFRSCIACSCATSFPFASTVVYYSNWLNCFDNSVTYSIVTKLSDSLLLARHCKRITMILIGIVSYCNSFNLPAKATKKVATTTNCTFSILQAFCLSEAYHKPSRYLVKFDATLLIFMTSGR